MRGTTIWRSNHLARPFNAFRDPNPHIQPLHISSIPHRTLENRDWPSLLGRAGTNSSVTLRVQFPLSGMRPLPPPVVCVVNSSFWRPQLRCGLLLEAFSLQRNEMLPSLHPHHLDSYTTQPCVAVSSSNHTTSPGPSGLSAAPGRRLVSIHLLNESLAMLYSPGHRDVFLKCFIAGATPALHCG